MMSAQFSYVIFFRNLFFIRKEGPFKKIEELKLPQFSVGTTLERTFHNWVLIGWLGFYNYIFIINNYYKFIIMNYEKR